MMLRAVLASLLAFPAPLQAAAVLPYDAKAAPLDVLSQELLTGHGYELRGDGKVLDKISETPVRADEMPYLLSRLASARRLKVLLQLNLLLNRGGERKLSSDERAAVKELARQNWALFAPGTRRDLRTYFSPEELAELGRVPLRFDNSSVLLRDPEPLATAVAPGAAPSTFPQREATPLPYPDPAEPRESAPEPAARPKAYFRPTPVLTPFLQPLSLRRPSPYVTALPPEPAPETQAPAYAPAPAPAYAPSYAPAPAYAPAPSAYPSPSQIPAYSQPPRPSPAQPVTAPAPAAVAAAPVAAAPPPAAVAASPAPPAPLAPALPLPPSPAPQTPPPAAARPAAPPPSAVKVTEEMLRAVAQGKPIPLADPGVGVLKPWTPPPATAEPAASAPAVAAAAAPGRPGVPDFPPPAPAAPAEPKVALGAADVQAEAFAKFIAEGPYGRDDRALLEFLAKKAPEFCRPLLLRTVARTVPRIVFDGSRTGWGQRSAGYLADPTTSGSTPLVALSPGPILVERRRGLFGKDFAVLPESDALYAELGLPAPKLEAAKKGAASVAENDARWGSVKVYPDRSRRAAYSPHQQAGDLLYELLLIGLQREGFGASTLAARTWADAARFMLYARLREELGHDAFLDPDRRVELRERLERPDEARDRQIGAWSSARSGLLDPRRGAPAGQLEYENAAQQSCARSALADKLYELARRREAAVRAAALLADSGFAEEGAAAAAIKAVTEKEAAQRGAAVAMASCPAEPAGREEALRRSAALFAEAARLERAFRDARARKGDPRED